MLYMYVYCINVYVYVYIFMLRICVGSLDFELKQEPELFFHKEKFSQKLGILIFLLEKFEKSLIREASRPGQGLWTARRKVER